MAKVRYKSGKRFEVIKATTKPLDGIRVGNNEYRFGPNGSMYIGDSGVAREIEQEYGHTKGNGDVVVSPVTITEPGHNYFFGSNRRFREGWERIFGKG